MVALNDSPVVLIKKEFIFISDQRDRRGRKRRFEEDDRDHDHGRERRR